MKELSGKVFSIAKENPPVLGCTVSKSVSDKNGFFISWFSFATGTDISPEIYRFSKLWLVLDGKIEVLKKSAESEPLEKIYVEKGKIYVTPVGIPVGAKTEDGAVYAEIQLKEDTKMNEILKSNEVFELKNILPYQEGKIVNMDLINEEKLKFVLMSFDEGTGLTEHAAPGEAIIFALDGTGIIGYEGKEHKIKAGENFKFDKGGAHYVKADGKFKMALLLTLE